MVCLDGWNFSPCQCSNTAYPSYAGSAAYPPVAGNSASMATGGSSGDPLAAGGSAAAPPVGGSAGMDDPLAQASGAGGAAGADPALAGAGGAGGAAGDAGAGGAAGAAGAGGSTATPAGPDDGDPNAPIFTIPDVACGGPVGGFGMGSANFQLDGRDMIVTYPCNKHAGAPMIFFMNLHGTTPVAQHFYQHGYFSIHNYTESHNLIVVTPSSVVEQWGNGDNGQDAPHLAHIVEWVYATFDGPDKFDIRAMWSGGHSWGAMYVTMTYACLPELADKMKGAVIMSGMGSNPSCADRLSVISTAAETDIGPVVNQGTVPSSHGCDAEQSSMIGNNEETHWPNCDPGFAHANYFMLGKQHTSPIDDVVVQRIADLMLQARP
jgi:hypothetical protein